MPVTALPNQPSSRSATAGREFQSRNGHRFSAPSTAWTRPGAPIPEDSASALPSPSGPSNSTRGNCASSTAMAAARPSRCFSPAMPPPAPLFQLRIPAPRSRYSTKWKQGHLTDTGNPLTCQLATSRSDANSPKDTRLGFPNVQLTRHDLAEIRNRRKPPQHSIDEPQVSAAHRRIRVEHHHLVEEGIHHRPQ